MSFAPETYLPYAFVMVYANAYSTSDFLVNMSASADVLAQAKVEVDLAAIPEGKNVIIKWRGKPVFIRHRTGDEIKEAEDTKWEALRDPQPDSDRVQKPEWLIMLGKSGPCVSPSIDLAWQQKMCKKHFRWLILMINRRLHTLGMCPHRRSR